MIHRFDEVDVFTAVPLLGNPLAVVHEADGLSTEQMAAIARWTNFSETTFLLSPTQTGADYRVRIFTPGVELPFAGHPTLGSCWAWLAAGGQPRASGDVVQECGIGLVRVRRDAALPARLAFAAPPLRRRGPVDETTLAQITRALAIGRTDIVQHQWVDNGPNFCALLLRSAAEVLAIRPDWAALGTIKLGLIGPHPRGGTADFEVRAFVPGSGVNEDPVTGSLNAGLALWLIDQGLAPPRYVAAQGAALQRAGRVYVQRDDEATWIGGDVVRLVEGRLTL